MIRSTLDAASNQGSRIPIQTLAQMRQTLAGIAHRLLIGLDIRDSERVGFVFHDVNDLIEYIDKYSTRNERQ